MLAHNSHSFIKELLLYLKSHLQSKYTVILPYSRVLQGLKVCRSKIIPGSSKKQNLNSVMYQQLLRSINAVLGIIGNLEMI